MRPLYNMYSVSIDPSVPKEEVMPWLEQMAGT